MYFTDGVFEMLQKNLTEAKYTVTFDSCGGELTDTEQHVYAGHTITVPIPIWAGHRFLGWYLDEEYAQAFDFSQPITESYIRLKAKWTINVEVSLNYQTGTYKLTGFYDELDTIVLPQRYNDKLITSVGDNVFSNNCAVTTIVIPEGYTSVGRYAFSWCENLTSIVFPNTC